MVSPPSMSSFITLTSTQVTTMSTGSNSDLQQNTQSLGNAGLALMSVDDGLSIQSLLPTTSKTHRTHVSNANGMSSPVTSVGTVMLTPLLPLEHTLLVPSLSNNLLSMSQVTEQLNCLVLMYHQFCLLQDLNIKDIIGHGTGRRLYYVDDICSGNALTNQSSRCAKKHQIWMWHCRYGHASFAYIKHLFPSLFLDYNPLDFPCNSHDLTLFDD
ncbi:hypothetical protein CR513_37663, partial [Mucuna pruriens]